MVVNTNFNEPTFIQLHEVDTDNVIVVNISNIVSFRNYNIHSLDTCTEVLVVAGNVVKNLLVTETVEYISCNTQVC